MPKRRREGADPEAEGDEEEDEEDDEKEDDGEEKASGAGGRSSQIKDIPIEQPRRVDRWDGFVDDDDLGGEESCPLCLWTFPAVKKNGKQMQARFRVMSCVQTCEEGKPPAHLKEGEDGWPEGGARRKKKKSTKGAAGPAAGGGAAASQAVDDEAVEARMKEIEDRTGKPCRRAVAVRELRDEAEEAASKGGGKEAKPPAAKKRRKSGGAAAAAAAAADAGGGGGGEGAADLVPAAAGQTVKVTVTGVGAAAGKKAEFEIAVADGVAALQAAVRARWGIPPARQRIVHDGKQIAEIPRNKADVTVFLVVKDEPAPESEEEGDAAAQQEEEEEEVVASGEGAAAELRVHVRGVNDAASGKEAEFTVPRRGGVARLKELIRDKWGIDVGPQRVILNGQNLESFPDDDQIDGVLRVMLTVKKSEAGGAAAAPAAAAPEAPPAEDSKGAKEAKVRGEVKKRLTQKLAKGTGQSEETVKARAEGLEEKVWEAKGSLLDSAYRKHIKYLFAQLDAEDNTLAQRYWGGELSADDLTKELPPP